LIVLAACSHQYDYAFHTTAPSEDADLRAEVHVDTAHQTVELAVTNKTDQVLQVEWARIALVRADGRGIVLHPDVDLGWIPPGATQPARLVPLAVPTRDKAALADDGKRFALRVPMIVRRERRIFDIALVAQVHER
jgi:hypothetical protein